MPLSASNSPNDSGSGEAPVPAATTANAEQERQLRTTRDALNVAEERLRLATVSAHIGTWDLDPITDTLFWDAQCRAAFGYPLDLPIDYPTCLSLIHPDDREPTDAAVNAALSPSGSGEYAVEFRTIGYLDGVERWARVEGKALFDAEHTKATRFIGTIRDVTESKRVEEELREARSRLESALLAGNIATWTFDIVNNRVVADTNLARLFSVSPEDAAGGELGVYLAAIHPEDQPYVVETINRAIEREAQFEAQYRVTLPEGAHRWLVARGTVERDAAGKALALPGVVVDVTEHVEQERRERFLAELAERARTMTDPETVIADAVQSTGAFLHVSRCLFADTDIASGLYTIAPDYRADESIASIAGELPAAAFGAQVLAEYQASRAVTVRDVRTAPTLVPPETVAAYESIGIRAFISVPVVRSSRLVSLLVVHQDVPRDWKPEEIELLRAVVERTWLTVENARLFREMRQRAEREALLNQIGTAVRETQEPEEILQAAVSILGQSLGVDRCYFVRSNMARDTARVSPEWKNPTANLDSLLGRTFQMSDYPTNRDAFYVAGKTHVLPDVTVYGPEESAALLALNIRALLRVSMHLDGQMTALSVAMSDRTRQWTDDEVRLVENVAALVRSALESAQSRQRERNIAQQLQDALIPSPPTDLPGLALASFYRPALNEASVGGDFFDVFAVEEGCTALVVADLSGKGLQAASQVSTVRNMLRYVLYTHPTISEAVTSLHRTLVAHSLLTGFATLFVGMYDDKKSTFTYVNCGQEPGLIWRKMTGSVEMLPPTGPVLGGFGDGDFEQVEVPLREGDVLALFTDGLTEVGPSRKIQLDVEGVSEVLHDCCTRPSSPSETQPPQDVVDCLIAGVDDFARGGVRDDIALLVGVVANKR